MARINKKTNGFKSKPVVTNEEGYDVFVKDKDVALFEMMNSFIFKGGFYASPEEKLKTFETLIKDNDKDFVLASALFASNCLGIRLAPVLALTNLVNEKANEVNKLAPIIYKRPDQIANSLAYAKNYLDYKSIKDLPNKYKKTLRKIFESFGELTLKKFKMKKAEVKLADLIKVLRPKPKNEKISKLYKAIIENDKLASIKEEEHITATMSSTKLTDEQKHEIIEKDVKDIPINALIRNLKQFNDSGSEVINVIERRIGEVLKNNAKIVNPFDLVFVNKESYCDTENLISKGLVDMVDEQLNKNFISKMKFDTNNVKFLIDISGSMEGQGITMASKFFSLMYSMFKNKPEVFLFNHELKKSIKLDVIAEKYKGYPNAFAEKFLETVKTDGGTSMLECLTKVLNKDQTDLVVVLTDEMTWFENQDVFGKNKEIQHLINQHNSKMILVNTQPDNKTAIGFKENVLRMSAIDGKIFNFIDALADFPKFKKRIISDYKEVVDCEKGS